MKSLGWKKKRLEGMTHMKIDSDFLVTTSLPCIYSSESEPEEDGHLDTLQ